MDDHSPEDRAASHPTRPVFDSGFCDPGRRRLVLTAAILGSAMGFIDGTVLPIALPSIRETLGATFTQGTWINNAYMVTLSALILVGGAFGDRFGLAKVFNLGIAVFVLSSLVCALAPTPEMLIAARLAQGAGAALVVPGSLAIISRAYPKEIRGAAIGFWAAASAVTTAAGPIIGGLALTLGGPEMWRWVFAINLPLGIVAIYMIRRGVQNDAGRPGERIDVLGAVLAIVALGGIALALNAGEGDAGSIRAWLRVTAGSIGTAALVAFIVQEYRAPNPMMPLRLFRSRTFSAANAATLTLYFGLSAILFFLPILTISAWGVSEIESAAAFAPLSIFLMLFSTRFGRLADRIGTRPVLAMGAGVVAFGYGALALVIPTMQFWTAVLPVMLIMGLGMSMVVAPLSTAIMGAVDDAESGTASGINNAISRMAGLIAVAAMSSVVALVYKSAGGGLSFGITSSIEGHVVAMNTAFATVCWVSAGLALVASAAVLIGIPAKRS